MDILRVAILSTLRQKRGKEFSPLEVIQSMYPEDWEYFQQEIFDAAKDLQKEGLIEVWSENELIGMQNELPHNSRIRTPSKLI